MQTGPLFLLVALIVSPLALPAPLRLGPALSWAVPGLFLTLAVCAWEAARGRWEATRLDGWLAAYVVWIAVAGVFGVNRWESLKAAIVVAGHVGAFYAGVIAARHRRAAGGLLAVIAVGAAIVELIALTYHLDVGLAARPTAYAIPLGWSGYPELGALAVIQLAILAGGLLAASRASTGAAIGILAVVSVAEVVLLYSRTAWAGAAVVAVVVLALNERRRVRTLVIAAVLAVAAGGFSLTLRPVRELVANAVGAQLSDGPTVNMAAPDARLQLWKKTLAMIGDAPLTGAGPGNFRVTFETRYNPDLNNDNRRGVHAHNLWLQQAAEMGIPGAVLLAVIWALGLWSAWRAVRLERSAVSYGVLLALVGATVSNLTDSLPGEVAGARLYLLIWILFGLAVGGAGTSGTTGTRG